jgi:hypothetical protein
LACEGRQLRELPVEGDCCNFVTMQRSNKRISSPSAILGSVKSGGKNYGLW